MIAFNLKTASTAFFELHDKSIFIDYCIYNDLIAQKSNVHNQLKFDEMDKHEYECNKKLWNTLVMRYQIVKNKHYMTREQNGILSELYEKIKQDCKKNTQFSFDGYTLGFSDLKWT